MNEKELQEKYVQDVNASCQRLAKELQVVCDAFVKAMVDLNKADKK